jgi:hypothetical protein
LTQYKPIIDFCFWLYVVFNPISLITYFFYYDCHPDVTFYVSIRYNNFKDDDALALVLINIMHSQRAKDAPYSTIILSLTYTYTRAATHTLHCIIKHLSQFYLEERVISLAYESLCRNG